MHPMAAAGQPVAWRVGTMGASQASHGSAESVGNAAPARRGGVRGDPRGDERSGEVRAGEEGVHGRDEMGEGGRGTGCRAPGSSTPGIGRGWCTGAAAPAHRSRLFPNDEEARVDVDEADREVGAGCNVERGRDVGAGEGGHRAAFERRPRQPLRGHRGGERVARGADHRGEVCGGEEGAHHGGEGRGGGGDRGEDGGEQRHPRLRRQRSRGERRGGSSGGGGDRHRQGWGRARPHVQGGRPTTVPRHTSDVTAVTSHPSCGRTERSLSRVFLRSHGSISSPCVLAVARDRSLARVFLRSHEIDL
eukprot:gene487-biopygen6456